MNLAATALCLVACHISTVSSFVPSLVSSTSQHRGMSSIRSTATSSSSSSSLEKSVGELKKILYREYATFFEPMYTEYYASDVSFVDPMTSLSGVAQYQNNVDMLASRTLLGKYLFSDAGIVLHSVTGGDVDTDSNTISDLVSRWTLRFTFKALPWKPTARFTGISKYKVVQSLNDKTGVKVVGQLDYWDSINILPGGNGRYEQVGKSAALGDFLNQIKPSGLEAKQSGPELPYQLLRRGNGYEVREYPEYVAVRLPYSRRDEGFGSLGAFTRGMNPMAPAIMNVYTDDTLDKYMSWPLAFAPPGSDTLPELPKEAEEKAGQGQWRTIKVQNVPSQVVAVAEFNDASMGPVVRMADRNLREALERDGLKPADGTDEGVMFAQYDAIFSMGKRRGEAWIRLADGGHPW